jgi:hypothetical protein
MVDRNRPAHNKMFLQWCRDELVLSFIFVQRYRFVGQDAASERHHCRNTNVGGKHLNKVVFMNINKKRVSLLLLDDMTFPET